MGWRGFRLPDIPAMVTPNKYLEKIAIDLGSIAEASMHHAAAGGALHVAQNAATHLALTRSSKYRQAFQDYFHAGLQGLGHPSTGARPAPRSAFTSENIPSEMHGEAQHLSGSHHDRASEYVTPKGSMRDRLFGAANPELKILLEEAHAAGKHAREEILKRHNGATQNRFGTTDAFENKLNEGATLKRHAGSEHTIAARDSLNTHSPEVRTSMNRDMDVFSVSDSSRGKYNAAHDAVDRWGNAGLKKTQQVQDAVGRRGMVIYSRALRGDFTHLHDMAKRNPHLQPHIHQALLDMERETRYPVTAILRDKGIASRVEEAYKKNPVTGRLISSLSNKPRDMSHAANNLSERSSAMMQGAAITGAMDPVAGALNASKLILSDKNLAANNPVVDKVGRRLTDMFVTKPLNTAVHEGFVEEKRHGPMYRLYNKFVMNNALGHVEDAANAMSHAAGKNMGPIRRNLSVPDDIQ